MDSPAIMFSERHFIPYLFLASLLSSAWVLSEELRIERVGPEQLRLSVTLDGADWHRIEKTNQFEEWTIARDFVIDGDEVELATTGAEQAYYRIAPRVNPELSPVVAVIGDSTAVGIETASIVEGWAEPLANRLGPGVRLMLAGEPGLSSKSFERSRWPSVLRRTQPSLVFIQLGQIDQYTQDAELKRTTVSEYSQFLSEMIDMVRAWDGIPILVTPLPWREFAVTGALLPRLANRRDAMRELSLEKGVLLVDLHSFVSLQYLTASDESLSEWGPDFDLFHLSPIGAVRVADFTVDALPEQLAALFFQSNESVD